MKRLFLIILLALATPFVHADATAISGSLTATGQTLTLNVVNSNTWGVQLSGSWVASLLVEGTVNSTSWVSLVPYAVPGYAASTSLTASGVYIGSFPGMSKIRLRATTFASGTVAATLSLADSLPTGVPVTMSLSGTSIAITQGGPLFVSGSVSSSPSAAYAGVSVKASALPTGASTEATQLDISDAIGTIPSAGKTIASGMYASGNGNSIADILDVMGGVISNIQSFTFSIDNKTPSLGQALSAASVPVVIASNQSAVPVSLGGAYLGVSVTASALPTGAATSALQTTGNTSLSSMDTKTPALGQANMAGSVPVTLASNQGPVAVTGTVTLAPGYVGVTLVAQSQAITVAGTVTTVPPSGYTGVSLTAINNTALAATIGSTSSVNSNLVGVPAIASLFAWDSNAATTRRIQVLELNGASQGSTTLGFSGRSQTMGWDGTNLIPIKAIYDGGGNTRLAVMPPALGGMTGVSLSAYYWSTMTAVPQNGTFTTGINGPFMVTLCPNFGGPTIKAVFHNTTFTPDTLLVSRMGEPTSTTPTACLSYGPFNPGMQVSVMATGATGVSGTAEFYAVK